MSRDIVGFKRLNIIGFIRNTLLVSNEKDIVGFKRKTLLVSKEKTLLVSKELLFWFYSDL